MSRTRLALAVAASIIAPAAVPAQPVPERALAELDMRYLGPVGNRASTVAGVPGDPSVYFAGAASGGIFKSEDGGVRWRPVFDETPASSIGALAVAPSDPNVVWAGTGESFIRSNVSIGDGIYRSTDGGESWLRRGLEQTGRIGRILVHPRDENTVWAAALGHLYGPQEERGVYRTRDGGESWERILFVDRHTGAIDLAMAPDNPRVLYAAMWQMEIKTWGRWSGGAGSGLYKSTDGGDSWTRLGGNGAGRGLPTGPWGKIGLTTSAADPDRVWALIETNSNPDYCSVGRLSDTSPEPCPEGAEVSSVHQGVLWRSEDRGDRWSMINADNTLHQRPLYYTRMVAAPDDANEVTFMAVQQSISHDGGASIEPQNSGWDHHDLWIDPEDPDRRISGHDGGVSITTDRGRNWYRPQLPIAQMYHVATDDRIPYYVYGNRQDGPTFRGPSNTLTGESTIPIGYWHSVGGCEVGFALPDRANPDIVWSGCYDGILDRHDLSTGHTRNVSVWPMAIESWPAAELRLRIQWTAPLALSPHHENRVYYGSQYVHRTENGGQSWELISPDLTGADPHLMKRWGGLTLDDAGPTIAPVVFAIAESPITQGEIWAGTNDGRIQLTRDDGVTWTDLTERIPELPPLGTVSNIEPSRHEAGRAYFTVDRHQLGDTEPWVYRTDDWGASWNRIDASVPRSTFSYAHCVREDPVRPGMLFLGTENSLYLSYDDGATWQPFDAGLPPAPVHWITVQEHFSDLVIATYGRGIWILDDLTPLRALGDELFGTQATLLEPRSAYRFLSREAANSQPDVPADGHNPSYGATLHYWIGEPAAKDDEGTEQPAEVRIEIRDASDRLVRTLDELDADPGLHRVVWNLRGERTPEIELLTQPRDNPHVKVPPGGHRRLRDGGRVALLELPGNYRLTLFVDDVAKNAVDLEVRQDPSSTATPAELTEQRHALEQLHGLTRGAAETINAIERARADLDGMRDRLAEREGTEPLLESIGEIEGALEAVEGELFDLRLSGASQDTLRWKRLLYARLASLAYTIGRTDDRPTDAQIEVLGDLEGQYGDVRARWLELRDHSLSELDRRLREIGAAGIWVQSGEEP